jgi:hypothetical protein
MEGIMRLELVMPESGGVEAVVDEVEKAIHRVFRGRLGRTHGTVDWRAIVGRVVRQQFASYLLITSSPIGDGQRIQMLRGAEGKGLRDFCATLTYAVAEVMDVLHAEMEDGQVLVEKALAAVAEALVPFLLPPPEREMLRLYARNRYRGVLDSVG